MTTKTYEKRKEVVGSKLRVNFVKGKEGYEQMVRLKAIYGAKTCREIIGDLIDEFLKEPVTKPETKPKA